MSKTFGHVSTITSTSWHPIERDIILTSSTDGSARIWDLRQGKTTFQNHLKCSLVYRLKSKQGRRTGVTCAAYHPSGRFFVAGTMCGSIQVWKASHLTTSTNTRPDHAFYDIHGGMRVNFVMYNLQGTRIASRGDDDSLLLWDAKKLKQGPYLTIRGVVSWYEAGNCAFSPDGNIICVGISVKAKTKEKGKLLFYDCTKSNTIPILEIDVAPVGVSAVRVLWHPKLNQIFVGLSNGM